MTKQVGYELAGEVGEFVVDRIIEAGILRDIPIIGTAVKLCTIGDTWRDKSFGKKVNTFLTALDEVPQKEREKFKESIKNNKIEIEKLCEKILMSLENITDISKAEIIADLFIAYLDKEISPTDFRRCVDVVCNNFVDDIDVFTTVRVFHADYGYLRRIQILSLISSPFIFEDEKESMHSRKLDGARDEDLEAPTIYSSTPLGDTFKKARIHGYKLRQEAKKLI
jgi:hypothetical protein